jgi:hypothetical protein
MWTSLLVSVVFGLLWLTAAAQKAKSSGDISSRIGYRNQILSGLCFCSDSLVGEQLRLHLESGNWVWDHLTADAFVFGPERGFTLDRLRNLGK